MQKERKKEGEMERWIVRDGERKGEGQRGIYVVDRQGKRGGKEETGHERETERDGESMRMGERGRYVERKRGKERQRWIESLRNG